MNSYHTTKFNPNKHYTHAFWIPGERFVEIFEFGYDLKLRDWTFRINENDSGGISWARLNELRNFS